MRNLFILLIIAFCLANCGKSPLSKTLEGKIKEIKTIKSGPDDQFEDLQFLKEILKDKQIVLLGESYHLDENDTQSAQTRLIRFLHKELGFNTIATEGAGFYDIHLSQELALEHDKDLITMWLRPFPRTYNSNKPISPFWEYVRDLRNTDNPFIIWGIDTDWQPGHSNSAFTKNLRKYIVKNLRSDESNSFDWNRMDSTYSNNFFHKENRPTADREWLIKSFQKIRGLIKNQVESEEQSFWIQALKTSETELIRNNSFLSDQAKWNNVRDKQMAENFFWNMERDKRKNKKIIVTAASFHISHGIGNIIYTDTTTNMMMRSLERKQGIKFKEKMTPDQYSKFKLLGDYLHEEFGDRLYSIAFTSNKNKIIDVVYDSTAISTFRVKGRDLLESRFQKTGYNYAFVDFEKIRNNEDGANLSFYSKILGHRTHYGKWFIVFDGVFFIRE